MLDALVRSKQILGRQNDHFLPLVYSRSGSLIYLSPVGLQDAIKIIGFE